MTCTQTNLSSSLLSVITPTNIPSATLNTDRRLMLSDNPETLDSTSFSIPASTLWHDYVNTSSTTIQHRVYGWHLNNVGSTIKLGLTVQNLSSTNTIELQGVKREKGTNNTGQYYIVGQCLAKACLGGTLDAITPVDNKFGKSVGLIEEHNLSNGYLSGFLYEFTIKRYSGTGNLNYYVRTVASKSTSYDLRTITNVPLAVSGADARGSWPGADISATTPTYYIGQTASYSISNNTTDNLLSASASFDSGNAITNKGQYGATYRVRIPVNNDAGPLVTVRIRVNARGGTYSGAVKLPAGTTYGIPLITTTNPNVCHIMDHPAPAGLSYAEFVIMTAGAVSTPVAIHITTL